MEPDQSKTINNKIDLIKNPWKEAIKQLSGPFNYQEIRDRLNDKKYWFELPDIVLTFDGYIKILAFLQNTRNEIVREKLMIDEHSGTKTAALKNMEKILPGIFMDECKTDKMREARAAEELEMFTIFVKQAEELQKMATSILNNIDSMIAQINRQMKSVDMGIRTSSITTASAKDWGDEDEENDEEDTQITGWSNKEDN